MILLLLLAVLFKSSSTRIKKVKMSAEELIVFVIVFKDIVINNKSGVIGRC